MTPTTRTPGRANGWLLRGPSGGVRSARSLSHIARLVLDGDLGPVDEISAGDGRWMPVAEVFDPRSFAETLDALGHLDSSVTQGA